MTQTTESAVHLTEASFDEAINSGKPVLVDFWAAWCPPCRALGPTIDGLAAELGDRAIIAKVDVDAEKGLAARFDISSIPAVLIYKDGQVVDKIVGVSPAKRYAEAIEAAEKG